MSRQFKDNASSHTVGVPTSPLGGPSTAPVSPLLHQNQGSVLKRSDSTYFCELMAGIDEIDHVLVTGGPRIGSGAEGCVELVFLKCLAAAQTLAAVMKRPWGVATVQVKEEGKKEEVSSAESVSNSLVLKSEQRVGTEVGVHKELTAGSSSEELGIAKFIGKREKSVIISKCDAVLDKLDIVSLRKSQYFPFFLENFLESMCRTLDTLATHEYVHRDIKPPNIGIKVKDDGDIYFVAFDLGCATPFRVFKAGEFSETIGTPAFVPPEVTKCVKITDPSKIDIYAFSKVLGWLLGTDNIGMGNEYQGFGVQMRAAAAFEQRSILQMSSEFGIVDHYRLITEKEYKQPEDWMKGMKLLQQGMAELMPSNRLSLKEIKVVVSLLKEQLPKLQEGEKKVLLSYYKSVLHPPAQLSILPSVIGAAGVNIDDSKMDEIMARLLQNNGSSSPGDPKACPLHQNKILPKPCG